VDIDEVMRKFDLLEKKIEYLIEQCSTLEEDNLGLKKTVTDLEVALAAKNEAENKYSDQKALIRSKIDSLIERLNQAPGSATNG
jgi:chromosome segregation ATPase